MENDIKKGQIHTRLPRIKFSEYFENSPIAFYTCDSEGKLIYFNLSAEKLWGRAPVPGKESWCGSWKLYLPDGTPLSPKETPMALTLETGQAQENKKILVQRPDGSFRMVLVFSQPQFDEKQQVIGSYNTLVDISEEQREPSNRPVSAIVESSGEATY